MKCTHVFAFAVFVALLSVPVFGCKPNVESRNSIVTVTVTGDEHTVVQEPNTFQVNNGTQWQDVKARIRVTYADGFEGDSWKLGGKDGMGLSDDYRFTENATVFALSKQKHISTPITITVNADEGYGLRPEHTLTVEKGSLWKDIKTQAEGRVMLKDGRITDGWKRGTSEGAYLDDADTFTKDETVCAVSRKSTDPAPARITITVTGDEGVTVNSPVTFSAVSGAMWKNLKAAAEARITVKEKHAVKEWRLTGKDGEMLTGAKTFTKDETVFAGTEELKDVPADSSLFETDGKGTITGYTCAKNDLPKVLVIPGKIGEEVITKIGQDAFAKTPIEQLNFSQADSLIEIGTAAFHSCEKMAGTLVFPASLKTIGRYAFLDCKNLQSLDFSACVELTETGIMAFSDCTEVAAIVFSPSLKKIASGTFNRCSKLQNITLSACTELTEIDMWAFSDCTELATIVFPKSLKKIALQAFRDCSKLQSLDFSTCMELTEIEEEAFSRCEGLTAINFSPKLEKIDRSAFLDCKKLRSIDFSTCTAPLDIGKEAFSGCINMTEIVFPASLKTVGKQAFANLENLQRVDFSSCAELTEIGEQSFYHTGIRGTLIFPAKLKTIGKEAFKNCTSLTGINTSSCRELTEIGTSAFFGCTEMEGMVFLPTSLQKIGDTPFTWWTKIKIDINLSACTELTEIGAGAFFMHKEITGTFVFPAKLKTIGREAFMYCTGLTGIDTSACTALTEIGESAFYECKEMTGTLVFPATLTTIGAGGAVHEVLFYYRLYSPYFPRSCSIFSFFDYFDG